MINDLICIPLKLFTEELYIKTSLLYSDYSTTSPVFDDLKDSLEDFKKLIS
jgi:hypothetical protein